MPIEVEGAPPGFGFAPGEVSQPRIAEIGDLLLGGVDVYGTQILLVELKGWDGASGTTLEVEQRASDDGAWYGNAFLPARLMEASLALSARSFSECSRSLSRLAALIPMRAPESMVVTDGEGMQLSADVIQGGELLSSQKGHAAKASVSLVAPDPRRYSVEEVVASTGLPATTGGLRVATRVPLRVQAIVIAGRLQVTNDGTIDTPPVFVVAGPCPPFTLTHIQSGRSLRYHEAVPAGRTVVVDVAARTALLDGVAPRYVTGSWISYEPGLNDVAFAADTYDAAAMLTSYHRHAWK